MRPYITWMAITQGANIVRGYARARAAELKFGPTTLCAFFVFSEDPWLWREGLPTPNFQRHAVAELKI